MNKFSLKIILFFIAIFVSNSNAFSDNTKELFEAMQCMEYINKIYIYNSTHTNNHKDEQDFKKRFLKKIKETIEQIEDKQTAVNQVMQLGKECLNAVDYTFHILDFEIFLEIFLLFLPHVENLQKKLDDHIKSEFSKNRKDWDKIAFLIYMGASCNVIEKEINDLELTSILGNKLKKTRSIIVGEKGPRLELTNALFWEIVHKINYFAKQQLIADIAKTNNQTDELKNEQKQILELYKYRKQTLTFKHYDQNDNQITLVW